MTGIRLPKQVIERIEERWWARFSKEKQRTSELIDERLERLRTHRNNIGRYRRLLNTELSDLERKFIERRLSEEKMAMQILLADIPPLAIDRPPDDEIISRSGEAQP